MDFEKIYNNADKSKLSKKDFESSYGNLQFDKELINKLDNAFYLETGYEVSKKIFTNICEDFAVETDHDFDYFYDKAIELYFDDTLSIEDKVKEFLNYIN